MNKVSLSSLNVYRVRLLYFYKGRFCCESWLRFLKSLRIWLSCLFFEMLSVYFYTRLNTEYVSPYPTKTPLWSFHSDDISRKEGNKYFNKCLICSLTVWVFTVVWQTTAETVIYVMKLEHTKYRFLELIFSTELLRPSSKSRLYSLNNTINAYRQKKRTRR